MKKNPDFERLKTIPPYLLMHNEDHIKDLKKWKKLADKVNNKEVSKEIEKAIELSEGINLCFKSAIKKLKKEIER